MLIQWRKAFEVGIDTVDEEHRHLAGLVNSFYDVYRAGHARPKVYTVLNLLVKYVEVHFSNEETLMEATAYPELEAHRALHDALAEQIFTLNERYAAGAAEITGETLTFLKTWLLDHIMQEDKKLAAHMQEHGPPPARRK